MRDSGLAVLSTPPDNSARVYTSMLQTRHEECETVESNCSIYRVAGRGGLSVNLCTSRPPWSAHDCSASYLTHACNSDLSSTQPYKDNKMLDLPNAKMGDRPTSRSYRPKSASKGSAYRPALLSLRQPHGLDASNTSSGLMPFYQEPVNPWTRVKHHRTLAPLHYSSPLICRCVRRHPIDHPRGLSDACSISRKGQEAVWALAVFHVAYLDLICDDHGGKIPH